MDLAYDLAIDCDLRAAIEHDEGGVPEIASTHNLLAGLADLDTVRSRGEALELLARESCEDRDLAEL